MDGCTQVCMYLVTYFQGIGKVERSHFISMLSGLLSLSGLVWSLSLSVCVCARGERKRAMSLVLVLVLVLACLLCSLLVCSCCSLLLATSLPGPCLSTGTGTRAWYGIPGYLTSRVGTLNGLGRNGSPSLGREAGVHRSGRLAGPTGSKYSYCVEVQVQVTQAGWQAGPDKMGLGLDRTGTAGPPYKVVLRQQARSKRDTHTHSLTHAHMESN